MRHAGPISSSRFAFTLIEILIVIAIIALLAALLFPAFSRARESGRQATCQTNLQQIYLATQQYFQDERRYPDSLLDLLPAGSGYELNGAKDTLPDTVNGYLKSGGDGVLCPNDDLDNTVPRSSYGALTKSLAAPAKPGDLEGPNATFTNNPDPGRYVWNYWGYDANGFAYATSQDAASNTRDGSPLLRTPTTPAAPPATTPTNNPYSPRTNPINKSLSNRFAPPSTVITHCVFHRLQTADDLVAPGQMGFTTGSQNARDIVLRLDGSTKALNVSQWNPAPAATTPDPLANKWQNQTP